jgi:hypothetical protein
LTSKFFDIKILQRVFASPAPSKTFKAYGAGGTLILATSARIPSLANGAANFIFMEKSTGYVTNAA